MLVESFDTRDSGGANSLVITDPSGLEGTKISGTSSTETLKIGIVSGEGMSLNTDPKILPLETMVSSGDIVSTGRKLFKNRSSGLSSATAPF